MDFDVVIDKSAHYIRVTISGQPAFGQLLSLIHLMGVESESWGEHTVLVDLRGVATPFSLPQQFRIGEEAALCLSHMNKIASLVPAERVTRVGENAARRSGTNVRVFDSEREAIAWLLEGRPLPLGRRSALLRALARLRPGSGSRG